MHVYVLSPDELLSRGGLWEGQIHYNNTSRSKSCSFMLWRVAVANQSILAKTNRYNSSCGQLIRPTLPQQSVVILAPESTNRSQMTNYDTLCK